MSWQDTDPIPLELVGQFVRQITHDVRNGLNAIDLQSAYLGEIVQEEEVKAEAQRLRSMVHETTHLLQVLSRKFQEPSVERIDCPADVLMESLESRMHHYFPKAIDRMRWSNEAGETSVLADVESVTEVVAEILRNAIQFATADPDIRVRTLVEGERLILEITELNAAEPSADPASWGVQPLVTARRGGYGLGLFKARASLDAQDGQLRHRYDASRHEITSRLSLPLAAA